MMLTADTLRAAVGCSGALADRYAEPLRVAAERYDIDSPARLAAWLAQLGHESARLARVVEILNYSADGLAATWPGRFRGPDGQPTARALALHRRPEAIANEVYAGRLGNGAAHTGDGWRYRGRGLIQITGRDNYRACGAGLGLDLEAMPETLEAPIYAALSAGWYWHCRGLNAYADAGAIDRITRTINGGLNGRADRLALYARARAALA